MSDVAIHAERLSKQYKLGVRQDHHDTLRDQLTESIRSIFTRNGRAAGAGYIWALKDASFEINKGEIVGIIGRNGAGKSTLLKILSRVTEPTVGSATIRGRVGSLLEVGTGFHHELTGRENIYLSGAILGMRKAEIERKFDEIVDFSGVEKFIDTPVKRFSSGMYVRLAFAVAAHLEPEILLVDEVLAVGDAGFQKKCLDRIRQLTQNGCTTLVVSHNMASIRNFCERCLWLEASSLSYDGKTSEAISRYIDCMNNAAQNTVGRNFTSATRRGTGEVRFTEVEVLDANGAPTTTLRMGDDMRIRVKYRAVGNVPAPEVRFSIRDVETDVVVTTVRKRGLIPDLAVGDEGVVECLFESIPLRPRRYSLYLGLADLDHRRPSYDTWDGAGPDIVVSSNGVAANGDFIVGLDAALVDISHRVTNVTSKIDKA